MDFDLSKAQELEDDVKVLEGLQDPTLGPAEAIRWVDNALMRLSLGKEAGGYRAGYGFLGEMTQNFGLELTDTIATVREKVTAVYKESYLKGQFAELSPAAHQELIDQHQMANAVLVKVEALKPDHPKDFLRQLEEEEILGYFMSRGGVMLPEKWTPDTCLALQQELAGKLRTKFIPGIEGRMGRLLHLMGQFRYQMKQE